VDGNGYTLFCNCSKNIVPCTVDCSTQNDNCICNKSNGQCQFDVVCVPPTTQPGQTVASTAPGTTCSACPTDANGFTCSNNGACQCGVCACANGFSGDSCSIAPGCGQYTDCATCTTSGLASNCTWCSVVGHAVCADIGSCQAVGVAVTCSGTISIVQEACPNNCSGNGQCVTDGNSNITQCHCTGGNHGIDCSAAGGLDVAAVAGAISGGIIAVIVIAGVIAIVLIGFGVKKGVDWIQLHDMSQANFHNNPIATERNSEFTSAIHEAKEGGH